VSFKKIRICYIFFERYYIAGIIKKNYSLLQCESPKFLLSISIILIKFYKKKIAYKLHALAQ